MTDIARTLEQLDRHGTASHEVYTAGFYAGDRDFEVRSLLGKASRGGSDAGEVLATIAHLKPKDDEAWFSAWVALGERIAAISAASAARGHRVSAARAALRAANYFAVAFNSIDSLAATDRLLPTFRSHRAAWDAFVANTRWTVDTVGLPYEGGTLPAWFFRPDAAGSRRPTLVVTNGSDGAVSGVWCEAAEAALERGYNVLMYDGPGQQSMLFERGIPFRPDWEKVVTPIVDFLVARADVDTTRLALYGVSQAGYWVPRALAFEHRFAAAIADGGVVEVGRSWADHVPHSLMKLYEKGETEKFDKEMALGMKLPGGKATRATWDFRARPYGASGFAAVLDAVKEYTLDAATAARIRTPLLITDPDGDQFFGGQSAELASMVPGSTLVRFTQEEGAAGHCEPMARELTEQRMFDWLDEQLG